MNIGILKIIKENQYPHKEYITRRSIAEIYEENYEGERDPGASIKSRMAELTRNNLLKSRCFSAYGPVEVKRTKIKYYKITSKGDKALKKALENGWSCPKCPYINKSSKSSAHLAKHHPDVIKKDINCAACGQTVTRTKNYLKSRDYKENFCSRECKDEYQKTGYHMIDADFSERKYNGRSNPNWKGGPKAFECQYCGEEVERLRAEYDNYRNHFCSNECQHNWQKESDYLSGSNHPNWKGGKVRYYGPSWYKQRRRARERDDHCCRICGKTADEIGREPDVHHIKKFRNFNSSKEANKLDNLVCLCPSCHIKWEDSPVIPTNS